ncbi:MAG: GntR family transcriptional regulator [Kiritimatiellia bacterium]
MANYSAGKVPDGGGTVNTLSRRVYSVLRDDILAGRLKPGERLVRKVIGERLGVSTIPVIEALYMLEIDGYVENRALAGCRVRSLTLEDIDNDLMLREALECQAARLCAQNAAPDELEKLMKRARQVDRFVRSDTPDQTLGSQIHWEFHIELGRLSGHSVFGEMLQKVWFQRYMSLNSLKAIRFEPPPEGWHQILVKKIKKGDPDLAEQAMREHVRFGRKDDLEALKVYLRESAAGGKKG